MRTPNAGLKHIIYSKHKRISVRHHNHRVILKATVVINSLYQMFINILVPIKQIQQTFATLSKLHVQQSLMTVT